MPNRGAGQEADAWFNTPELAPFANVLAKITTPAASVVRSRFSPVRAIHVPEPHPMYNPMFFGVPRYAQVP